MAFNESLLGIKAAVGLIAIRRWSSRLSEDWHPRGRDPDEIKSRISGFRLGSAMAFHGMR